VTTWSERFAANQLVKGEKAAYCPMLLSQADKALLGRAAVRAGLSPAVLASRIVSQVLQQNRHRFEAEG
jgi:hypothetical protein